MDAIIAALTVLQTHIIRAGRNKYGLNRTEVGEEVVAAKVFLGNVCGLWTKTADYWLENQQQFENEDSRFDLSSEPGKVLLQYGIVLTITRLGGHSKPYYRHP